MLKDRLKQLREARGLSQAQLADALGLSSGTIGGYENGSRYPKDYILAALADFFDVPVEDLAFGPELSPEQYKAFREKLTDVLDHTCSDDFKAMELSEPVIRGALHRRRPIRQDWAATVARDLNVNVDYIIYAKAETSDNYQTLISETRYATDDQLRKLLKYYELTQKGEL